MFGSNFTQEGGVIVVRNARARQRFRGAHGECVMDVCACLDLTLKGLWHGFLADTVDTALSCTCSYTTCKETC